jgi:hypothetical protein
MKGSRGPGFEDLRVEKRGIIPPFGKGRLGGILSIMWFLDHLNPFPPISP